MDSEELHSKLLIDLKETIQDCNINFLVGSGLSRPYLKTLGNIEILLTELDRLDLSSEPNKLKTLKASLYKKYYDGVIEKNLLVMHNDSDADKVLENYKEFLRCINIILLKRKTTLLNKQANVFTTNIDIFFEKALEDASLEFNDGFKGRFNPTFSLSNFKKSYFKKSLHYDNTSEIPVFNLLKVHGSLNWRATENEITLSKLSIVNRIQQKVNITEGLVDIDDSIKSIKEVIDDVEEIDDYSQIDYFLNLYEKLPIVNPTKEKFKHTLLNHTYYELLRIYSNELEKENTILFVLGFSFADEHIKEITFRALNSNPTMICYIVAYDETAKDEIESSLDLGKLRYDNIRFIYPNEDESEYTFSEINKRIFCPLKDSVSKI
jgi:hypothetical protein